MKTNSKSDGLCLFGFNLGLIVAREESTTFLFVNRFTLKRGDDGILDETDSSELMLYESFNIIEC
jgi:hypothetical protein